MHTIHTCGLFMVGRQDHGKAIINMVKNNISKSRKIKDVIMQECHVVDFESQYPSCSLGRFERKMVYKC